MKVKAISRSEEDYTRERKQDLTKVHRNLDPALHPLAGAHEYKRAENAVKLNKVFSKPFIGALAGHSDGVTCMTKCPTRLNSVISGAADGEIRVWDVPARQTLRKLSGHSGVVTGVCVSPHSDAVVSCGTDCTVRLWRLEANQFGDAAAAKDAVAVQEAEAVFERSTGFRAVDHHWEKNMFATAGVQVDVWDHTRSDPVQSFSWGTESVYAVRFNPAEPDIFATAGSDRSIALYDLRMSGPMRKLVLQNKTNSIAWNPMEAFNFTIANEDTNLYSYDMRKLKTSTCVHQDFVSAVMDVDYSPTGREFVAGSYDRTVRLFAYNGGHSREVYHTKRMQRVYTVKYSSDAAYIFSGSDDMNVRIWKADPSAQLGTLLPREKRKQAYNKALIDRYRHLPDVRRIERHKHLPKAIVKAHELRRVQSDKDRRKKKQKIAHSAPGTVKETTARKEKFVTEME